MSPLISQIQGLLEARLKETNRQTRRLFSSITDLQGVPLQSHYKQKTLSTSHAIQRSIYNQFNAYMFITRLMTEADFKCI